MIPLPSITSRTITAPASLVRRSMRASIPTPALKLGWKVDGVSPMGYSALADIAAQMPESQTHLTQDPAQSAVSGRVEDGRSGLGHPASPCFPSPLIKPDVPISGIRLSDWLHLAAVGGAPSAPGVAGARPAFQRRLCRCPAPSDDSNVPRVRFRVK